MSDLISSAVLQQNFHFRAKLVQMPHPKCKCRKARPTLQQRDVWEILTGTFITNFSRVRFSVLNFLLADKISNL